MGDTFKNKKNGKFYILVEKVNETSGKFILIEDKYSYTIPFIDMELWLSHIELSRY